MTSVVLGNNGFDRSSQPQQRFEFKSDDRTQRDVGKAGRNRVINVCLRARLECVDDGQWVDEPMA